MLTAHLPAGYCLAKSTKLEGLAYVALLFGAIFPDLDMLFFYIVDNGALHHHRYWVHIPAFWLVLTCLVLPALWQTRLRKPALAFLAGIALHLCLDSINGGIMWRAPFDSRLLALITVSPTQHHWVWSFVFHWTFILELLVWATAASLHLRARQGSSAVNT